MAEWLSEEWLKEVAALAGSRPPLPGATGRVSVAITDGRGRTSRTSRTGGDLGYHWRYQDGVPGAGGTGVTGDAELALVMARADAWDVLTGQVEPSVAYMRGRLRATGDGRLLLELLESTATDAYRAWLQQARNLAGPLPADS